MMIVQKNGVVAEDTHMGKGYLTSDAKQTVLVVDDNPTNLGVLFDILKKANIRVRVATNGEAALASINHMPPDIILLDVMMPGLNGFETCHRLKANEATRDIPVIFMTALSEPVDEVKGLQLGAVDYITKPIRVETVLARIETHLTLRNLQRNLQEKNNQLEQANRTLQRQRQIAEGLRENAVVLNSSLDQTTVLSQILEHLGWVIAYDSAGIFLVDGDDLVITSGANLTYVNIGHRLPLKSQDPAARVFKQKQTIILADTLQETNWQIWNEGDKRIRSWIGTPLLVEQTVIGVLTVDNFGVDVYSQEDAQLLQTFAHQAAVAIRNARQVQRTESALHEVGLLYRIGSILAKTSDVQASIEKTLSEYLWALNVNQGCICLFETDDTGQELCAFYVDGQPQPDGWQPERARSLQPKILDGRPVAIPDAPRDPLLQDHQDFIKAYRIKSILLAPLIVRGQVIGLLGAEATDQPRHFSEREMDLAQAVAGQIATAIENSRLFNKEQRQRQLTEKQNQELDAFAHTVAHNLKNPLGIVVTYSDYLINHLPKVEPDEVVESLKTVRQSALKGANIINELLLLASVRKQEVPLQPLDMAWIITQAEQRLNFMIEEYQGELIIPETWPPVKGYTPWVEEVWVNYLSNGLKYGGQPPRLTLGATPQTDGLTRFWVQDNGPGIAPEIQETLFTEFTRLSEVRAKGHGLGLSIVRRIVEKLGGQAGVESNGRQGSLFYFTLPNVESNNVESNVESSNVGSNNVGSN